MPKKAIDFSRNLIYKIVCKDLTITELYVGHTTDFKSRKRGHKTSCNNENSKAYNLNVYTYIRENGGWDNWSMIEVEKYSCNDLNEATARERYWVETFKANLNSNSPSRTKQEYYNDNKDVIKEKAKEYYKDNSDKIKERDKEFYKQNKEEKALRNKKYYNDNKDVIKERNEEYRELNKEHQKEYQEKNKEKINQKRRERYALKKGITP